MPVRVAINGFGRIGRRVIRCEFHDPAVEFVAINDLTDPATLAHLLKYDSVHGRFPGGVTHDEKHIIVAGTPIAVLAQTDPAKIPWRSFGVDIVLECTGLFTDRAGAGKHLEQQRVVARMQANRGLVQDVADAAQIRAELRGQPDALCLAAR